MAKRITCRSHPDGSTLNTMALLRVLHGPGSMTLQAPRASVWGCQQTQKAKQLRFSGCTFPQLVWRDNCHKLQRICLLAILQVNQCTTCTWLWPSHFCVDAIAVVMYFLEHSSSEQHQKMFNSMPIRTQHYRRATAPSLAFFMTRGMDCQVLQWQRYLMYQQHIPFQVWNCQGRLVPFQVLLRVPGTSCPISLP